MPNNVLVLALVLLTAGCASTVKQSDQIPPTPVAAEAGKSMVLYMTGSTTATTAKDWHEFKGVWRDACTQEATAVGAAFAIQEGEPKPTGESGTLVVVDVADFRYVSTGARIMFGVMTGNAFVNAQVTFRDLNIGDVQQSKSYDTTSSAWQGIFSGMTVKQVRAMCHEIVSEIVR
jgi:uncharacterized protein YceK